MTLPLRQKPSFNIFRVSTYFAVLMSEIKTNIPFYQISRKTLSSLSIMKSIILKSYNNITWFKMPATFYTDWEKSLPDLLEISDAMYHDV